MPPGAGSAFILTRRSFAMRSTSKDHVTIPLGTRKELELLPHTEMEFELAGDHARIFKTRRGGRAIGSAMRSRSAPNRRYRRSSASSTQKYRAATQPLKRWMRGSSRRCTGGKFSPLVVQAGGFSRRQVLFRLPPSRRNPRRASGRRVSLARTRLSRVWPPDARCGTLSQLLRETYDPYSHCRGL